MSVEPSILTRPRAIIKDREDITIGSIIIYKNTELTKDEANEGRDYMEELSTTVLTPTQRSGLESESGKIPVLKLDGKNDYYGIFNNFMIFNVSESMNSISKVHMNFSNSWNAFFFDNSPTMISVSGALIDTEDHPYYQEFMTAYDQYLSGPALTSGGYSMILSYDGKLIDGFITSIVTKVSADSSSLKNFSMNILAKSTRWNRQNKRHSHIEVSNVSSTKNYLSNIYRMKGKRPYTPYRKATNE